MISLPSTYTERMAPYHSAPKFSVKCAPSLPAARRLSVSATDATRPVLWTSHRPGRVFFRSLVGGDRVSEAKPIRIQSADLASAIGVALRGQVVQEHVDRCCER